MRDSLLLVGKDIKSRMPNVVRANTNFTTMMIAERAAEFIEQGL